MRNIRNKGSKKISYILLYVCSLEAEFSSNSLTLTVESDRSACTSPAAPRRTSVRTIRLMRPGQWEPETRELQAGQPALPDATVSADSAPESGPGSRFSVSNSIIVCTMVDESRHTESRTNCDAIILESLYVAVCSTLRSMCLREAHEQRSNATAMYTSHLIATPLR